MKISVALLFVVAALLVGCKKADPMLGTWKLQIDEKAIEKREAPPGLEVSVDFKEDGKYKVTYSVMEQAQTIEGTYKLDGKNLTMTDQGKDGKPAPAKTVTLSDDMKSFPPPSEKLAKVGKMVKQDQ